MVAKIRDLRIDIIRGVAILTIVINHLTRSMQFYGLKGRPIPTPTGYGYSSAAEIFVIMSGYMVGLVYLSKPDPGRNLLRRALKLYFYNWLIFLCVLPIIAIIQNGGEKYWRIEFLSSNPHNALLEFALLLDAPRFLDILSLYIVFLLVAPAAVALYKWNPWALLGASVTTYLLAYVDEIFNLWDGLATWHFDPLAWQVIFFVPLVLGAKRAHVRLFEFFERPSGWISTAALGVILGVSAAAKSVAAHQYIPFFSLINDRSNLGPVLIIHVALILAFYAGLLVLARPVIHTTPFRLLAVIGRHSLNCFALGVVITYALTLAWDRLSLGYGGYIVATGIAVGLTLIAALIWDGPRSATNDKST